MKENLITSQKLSIIAFVICFSSFVFGQNKALQADLESYFHNFSLTNLDTRSLADKAQKLQNISIATEGKVFEILLTPRDLRSSRYLAEETTVIGVRRLEKAPVITYKGRIIGESDSQVRLTINDARLSGYFISEGEMFFIEPASNYSKLASPEDFVIYRQEDLVWKNSFICHSELVEAFRKGKELFVSKALQTPNPMRVLEIATEADFDFVNSAGGTSGAMNKISSILNMVEGLYENELNLTLSITYQHFYSAPDPFDGTSADTLLVSFQNYWNANYPTSQYPRDTAHLFTYKPNVRAQGYAYLGVVCQNPAYAYGLSGRVFTDWNWEEANFLITSHEIAHNLGATHSDAVPSCANTLMQSQLSGSTQLSFCMYSRDEVSSFVSANGSCLTLQSNVRAQFDFDGDNKTDISIFRPSVGEWWISRSSTGQAFAAQFGNGSDKITPGDFTGDGKADIAFWRPGTGEWFILRSEDSSFFSFPFGNSGDIPAPGDYDGDGKTDPAVFRPSGATWFILRSAGGVIIQQFGLSADVPTVADYDGDGKADIAIFRPSSGQWWIQRSSAGILAIQFGNSTDKPVPGDFTGDGKADIAFWRPSTGAWFVLRSENSSFFSFPFGANGDIPAPGDYDGDGKIDPAVFRPSGATWFVNRSTAGTQILNFGDRPLPNAFVP
jgi:hypothetical protein